MRRYHHISICGYLYEGAAYRHVALRHQERGVRHRDLVILAVLHGVRKEGVLLVLFVGKVDGFTGLRFGARSGNASARCGLHLNGKGALLLRFRVGVFLAKERASGK